MGSVGKSVGGNSSGGNTDTLIKDTNTKMQGYYKSLDSVLKNQYSTPFEKRDAITQFIKDLQSISHISDNSARTTYYITDNGLIWTPNKDNTVIFTVDEDGFTRGLSANRGYFMNYGKADEDLTKISNSLYNRWEQEIGGNRDKIQSRLWREWYR